MNQGFVLNMCKEFHQYWLQNKKKLISNTLFLNTDEFLKFTRFGVVF